MAMGHGYYHKTSSLPAKLKKAVGKHGQIQYNSLLQAPGPKAPGPKDAGAHEWSTQQPEVTQFQYVHAFYYGSS
ncbi:hypothetical protein SUGI_0547380 [Cryptomeria japonica]|nr:hypothetical protein SUGI_0547380 [Cryptomeria japonica]